MIRYSVLAIATLLLPFASAQDREFSDKVAGMVIGPKNLDLHKGAESLLAGRTEEGIELTLRGMLVARGPREEKAGLSNLCAGYTVLGDFDVALDYCEQLLARDDKSWRAYNNRALIYIMTEQFDKALQDLDKAEQLSPGAPTLAVARTLYRDAVDPVEPQVTIYDGPSDADAEDDGQPR